MDSPSFFKQRLLGGLTLGLIFAAGMSFTWVYLSESNSSSQVAIAQAAVAISEPPKPVIYPEIDLQASSAILVDETTGTTLYARNPDVQLPLASLTKVPLALVVTEVLEPELIITIPYDTSPLGSFHRLAAGEHWKVKDIVDFTLAVSSNSGADILASAADRGLHVKFPQSPEKGATLWRMNDLARELNLTNTYFLNTNGLDESDTQGGAYGSARDMERLFAFAASTAAETFTATTKPSFKMISIDGIEASAINTDEALPAIPGMILGKTGYTDLAGGNLAVAFNHEGHLIVAVVLGSSQSGRFEDMKELVKFAKQSISARP